jgi:hypothetical protein
LGRAAPRDGEKQPFLWPGRPGLSIGCDCQRFGMNRANRIKSKFYDGKPVSAATLSGNGYFG